MKRLILIIIPVLFIFASCNNTGESKSNQELIPEELVEIQIGVEGMTCSGCENTVNTELAKLDGVVHAQASHIDKNVIISVDTNISSIKEMEDCIAKVGYQVTHQ